MSRWRIFWKANNQEDIEVLGPSSKINLHILGHLLLGKQCWSFENLSRLALGTGTVTSTCIARIGKKIYKEWTMRWKDDDTTHCHSISSSWILYVSWALERIPREFDNRQRILNICTSVMNYNCSDDRERQGLRAGLQSVC
jgi:hypothetical protein